MRQRRLFMGLWACVALIAGLFACATGALAESMQVSIPLIAHDANCTAVLLDAGGNEVARQPLTRDVDSAFTVTLTRLGTVAYTAKLIDQDTAGTAYDKSEFTVKATLYYTPSDVLSYLLEIKPADDPAAPKKERVEFFNRVLPVRFDPPVRKQVTGNPPTQETFTFVLKPISTTAVDMTPAQMPMPTNGASGGQATMQITGSGSGEFGDMDFPEPGTYVYEIAERKGSATGYTYDTTIYTLTVVVTRVDDHLEASGHKVVKGRTAEASEILFVNSYSKSSGGGSTPEPTTTSVSGKKVWVDQSNAGGVRPDSVTVRLLADGEVKQTKTVSGSGDTWSFSFTGLPRTDSTGATITYTVDEAEVEYYESSVSGTTITNTLIPRDPEKYISVAGTKTWSDADDAAGKRPDSIVVWLLRDGEKVERRTVTAADGWKYAFDHQPEDNGYGHKYAYSVREDAVDGYFQRVRGYDITNVRLPDELPDDPKDLPPGFENLTEEELEELIELFGYDAKLWGKLLKTGDELPIYPFVFGGVGLAAVAAFLLIGRRRRKDRG